MAAQNDSVPSPEGSAPSNASGQRVRARPLVIASAALFIGVGALIAGIGLAGSARDGGPSISLELAPFPSAGEVGAVLPSMSFRSLREIGGHLIADPVLIEDSPQGPLPQIAPDGRAPMTAYGGGFDRNDKRPKIALVIRGLGVGGNTTALALDRLTPAVTLAFTPFAEELQSNIDKARGVGHEVLIEVPMEPFDFPDSDPGPHALLVAASAEENGKRLDWALSRATGYTGVMNLLGGRFMGEKSAIEPVLDHVARRGLLFFDNGANSSSIAITAARHVKAPIAIGTLTLDGVQTQDAIDAKLAELETAARQDGFAIGVGSAYPITIARAAEWALSAEARGFQLAPVSALTTITGAGKVANSE